ncbi:MAG: PorV/PorQ family protein [Candidatus Zixiibacteriota bacterium]|nr:MAG: PorV/PorQ family protein [candidate division Zixibacteria bacterium]
MSHLNFASRISLRLILLLALAGSVVAGDGDGGYAGAFLQVPAGARPTAMGGAYLAVSNDGAAPLFNPAGLSNITRPLFGSSYRVMQLDRKLGYVNLIFPVRGQAALGAHWLYAGSGSVEERNYQGDLTGYEISNNNHQFSVVFAKRFERIFSFGVNISYLHSEMNSSLAGFNTNSVGFDMGLMFYLDQLKDRNAREDMRIKDIQVGVTVKNIAKEYSWNSEKYNLKSSTSGRGAQQDDRFPVELGLGGSARFFERKLLLATDLIVREKLGPAFHAGAEYFVGEQLMLRTGFSNGRFTAGTGYLFKISNRSLFIDYAFSTDRADEGSEHIFSIDLHL